MDAKLPQLETVLDSTAMLQVLAANCLSRDGRYVARDCQIQHIRHKPGNNCLVQYSLQLQDQANGQILQQMFCGRVYPKGESASRWSKASAQPLTAVVAGPPVAHVPQLDLVVWAFPNERKLRGLDLLMDAQRLQQELLPMMLGKDSTIADGPTVVRYIP